MDESRSPREGPKRGRSGRAAEVLVDPTLCARTNTLALWMALGAGLLGAAGLFGWAAGIRVLVWPLPRRPPMMPNTAAALVIAACGFVAAMRPPAIARNLVRYAAGMLVAALGAVTTAEYAFGWTSGLDRLLGGTMLPLPFPGRPSPPTGIAFLLVGIALLVFDRTTAAGGLPSRWLGAAVDFVGLAALTGHAYGTGLLIAWNGESVIGVAVHVALALALLGGGIVLSRPDRGGMAVFVAAGPIGILARRLGIATFVVPAALGLLIRAFTIAGFGNAPLAFALLAIATTIAGLALLVPLASRIAQTEQAERVAQAQARARADAFEKASASISDALATLRGLDVSSLLQAVVLQARTLTGATMAGLGLSDGDPKKPFEPWVASGVPNDTTERVGRIPRPIGLLGIVAREGQVVRCADVHEHPAFRGLPPGHPPITSFLGVPIRYRGTPAGNLYLANKAGGVPFTKEDERIAEMLAARAGAAFETVRSYTTEATSRAWLRRIVDQMPEAVVVTDALGRIQIANQAARTLVGPGARPGEGLGGELHELLFEFRDPSGKAVPRESLPLTRAIERGETTTGVELVLRTKGGREVYVLAGAAPVYELTGAHAGAVVVLQDITMLKDLERLREEWIGMVAHDLRQPLASVSLAAQLLARSLAEAAGAQRAIGRIDHATRRLDRMIGDLLDMSRIEAHRLTVERQPLDLRRWTNEVVERAREILGEPVQIEVRGTVPTVHADPGRLEQVLMNLLSNAAKYGEKGAVIDVTVEAHEREVEIAVKNRGPGLLPEEMERLFSRFFRAQSAQQKREGLGLGLYISKGIIEAHGGRIVAESVPGQITTFRFWLPIQPP